MSLSRDSQQWITISVSALNYVYFQQTRLVLQCYRDPAEVRTVTLRNQSFPVKVVTLYSPGDFEIVIQSSCWTWIESVGEKMNSITSFSRFQKAELLLLFLLSCTSKQCAPKQVYLSCFMHASLLFVLPLFVDRLSLLYYQNKFN